jgi:hypothetical protein
MDAPHRAGNVARGGLLGHSGCRQNPRSFGSSRAGGGGGEVTVFGAVPVGDVTTAGGGAPTPEGSAAVTAGAALLNELGAGADGLGGAVAGLPVGAAEASERVESDGAGGASEVAAFTLVEGEGASFVRWPPTTK